MKVKPKPGTLMPFESNARKHITEPTTVPDTAYYRRAVARGDLLLDEPKTKTKDKD